MIKRIRFEHFRNVESEYVFSSQFHVIFGKNNSGKSNLLDGIRLAYSAINNDYFKIQKSDFTNSDDEKTIRISVEIDYNDIPTFNYVDHGKKKCGFKITVSKTNSGRYKKQVTLLNGAQIDYDIVREDILIPKVYSIPLIRFDDIYSNNLTTGISNFLKSEEEYKKLVEDSKQSIKFEMEDKIEEFKHFCLKFGQKLDVDFSEPRLSDEKIYIVEGEKEHNYNIGSGYKSIANIILNTLSDEKSIILIDEIENHLHPILIRTLIQEIRNLPNINIIGTTHSPIVINEVNIDDLTEIHGKSLATLNDITKNKLNTFLHPGRAEIVFADNVILVEGYTEELLLKNYIKKNKRNWTIVNVAGIMFEPYIELAMLLEKKLVVVSDDDRDLSEDGVACSDRFLCLQEVCKNSSIVLIKMNNTLETDLYEAGMLSDYNEYLIKSDAHHNIMVAKKKKKTLLIQQLIEDNINLDSWHIIEEIENEFQNS